MESGFQFSNPIINSITIKTNRDTNKSKTENIPIRISTNSDINENTALLKLNLIIGSVDENNKSIYSLFFDSEIQANFRWNDNITKDIRQLVEINGSTLLISYIRPILTTLSTQAGLEPFYLPFIDFQQIHKQTK